MQINELTRDNILKFILGGKATFTIRNEATGNRFTYKIKKHKTKDLFFVSLLYGPDNENDFRFLGTIFERSHFVYGQKSTISKEATSYKAFYWVFRRLISKESLETVTIWHEGKCAKCGRKLTVPESIESGFGPECVKMFTVSKPLTTKKYQTIKNENPQLRLTI